jgi:integrase/recombinase XerD
MSAWPYDNGAAIERFVRSCNLRHRRSPTAYRNGLGGFEAFLRTRGGELSTTTIREWLLDRSRGWTPYMVEDRGRKVRRFLDFLVAEGTLRDHPLAGLVARYRVRDSAGLIRALLSADPDRALKAIQPPLPFASPWGARMRAHIDLMRSMGYRYRTQAERFQMFDAFLQGRPELHALSLSAQLAALTGPKASLEQAWSHQVLGRELSRALHRLDPAQPVLPLDRMMYRRLTRERRRPHIYTPEETMLLLAYCAGLRLGELRRLDLRDLDLNDGIVDIRNSKFFKSRRLPLDPSTVDALRGYLLARRSAGGPQDPSAPVFWNAYRRSRYSDVGAQGLLTLVLRLSGVKPAKGSTPVGPRIHDVRHSFVVHRLLAWYRAGINPETRLPYLATYLGHKDIHSTLIYITVTRDLLEQAGDRFRRFADAHRSTAAGGAL